VLGNNGVAQVINQIGGFAAGSMVNSTNTKARFAP
jgi:hypothetical protein